MGTIAPTHIDSGRENVAATTGASAQAPDRRRKPHPRSFGHIIAVGLEAPLLADPEIASAA
ncbi:hypothetical protein ACSHT2_02585 [Bradyrhizobium sp. PUT101]|uniref:hypothetical protein n=1 Tax=Bradyrhizobium sp. PUT101 TaxID=3447427 RepID=UPI003F85A28B